MWQVGWELGNAKGDSRVWTYSVPSTSQAAHLWIFAKTLPENHHCHPGSPGSQSTEKSVWSRSHSRGPWEAVELAFQQGQLSEEESQLQALLSQVEAHRHRHFHQPAVTSPAISLRGETQVQSCLLLAPRPQSHPFNSEENRNSRCIPAVECSTHCDLT